MNESTDRSPHHPLPPRSRSRYAEQYAAVEDRARLEQIFAESERIARESTDASTARARYELALECAHQLVALGAHGDDVVGRLEQLGRSLDGGDADRTEALDPPLPAESATATDPDAHRDPGLDVALEPLSRVQPALADAGFHVLPELRLRHDGDARHRDLRIELVCDPPFARCEPIAVAEIGPGQTLVLTGERLPLRLDRAFFAGLSERAMATLTALVVAHGVGSQPTPELEAEPAAPDATAPRRVLARASVELELCPPGEWPGLAVPAEHLAAFVLPNEPSVADLLRRAADQLEEWTGSPALDGYQSGDAARVLHQAAAVYGAIRSSGVTYANPPASFAESGQRVRLPGDIADAKLGTCLDLALLAAAGLEQAGLHALVLLFEDHAAAGVWLRAESFAEAAPTDARRVVNHVELGDIALFDPTAASSRPAIDFDAAQALARADVAGARRLVAAVDVHRARRAGVRPLPTFGGRIATTPEGGGAEASAADARPAFEHLGELERLEAARRELGRRRFEEEAPEDRLERWRRRLLDLTMRNRLLAHREGKRTVPLFAHDVAALEDALSRGERFRIEPRPGEVDAARRRGEGATRAALSASLRELLASEMTANRLRADAGEGALATRVVTLYREARTATEEGGSSTLFLALGFLHYRELGGATERRAPILLVPVELTRESASKGFALALGAEEPRINVTLLQYLARDHGIEVTGLDPLPMEAETREEGGDGVDVALVLYTLRQAIRDKADWHVSEEAVLDLFSFAKILIWKDLADRRDDLLASPVVRHLVETPNEAWDAASAGAEPFPDPARLDATVAASEVLCPLSYDSSQLAAIVAAARGASFVLHGPPGTGKSQTITNLIAHLLGTGRRVLFVSEKRAALEVVHDRLEKVGLGEACLELHSNTARKKDVLEQMRRALEVGAQGDASEWERATEAYAVERGRLNAYVEALHAPRASGESLFDALARLVEIEDRFDLTLPWSDVAGTGPERLARARAAVAALARTGRDVGPEHPLLAVGRTEYTPLWDREARAAVDAWSERVDAAEAGGRVALPLLDMAQDTVVSRAGWRALATFIRVLDGAPSTVPPELLATADLASLDVRARDWIGAAADVRARRARLDERFTSAVGSLGLDVLERTIAEARVAWFLPAWLKKRGVVRAVRSIAKEPERIDFEGAVRAVEEERARAAAEASLAASERDARAVFGDRWKGAESDVEELEGLVRFATSYRDALGGMVTECEVLGDSTRRAAASALGTGALDAGLRTFLAKFDELEAATRELASPERLALDARAFDVPSGEDALASDRARARRWVAAWGELPRWCVWRAARDQALDAELGFLVDALESGRVLAPELSDAFERAFADQWFAVVASQEAVLAGFVGEQHDLVVERFRELDGRVLELATQALRARVLGRVAGAVVGGREAPESSEVGTLHRELSKKTRHMALRRLFEEIPSVLARLKPCLLMSPLSVAQYLDPAGPRFDAVVFDEASQIAIWDAIGAMARGSQVIVVGDPKQLPPTNFFERGADDDELDDVFVEDAESILDECLAARVPSLYLEWHYRSRHEGLIAFSNRRYYDGRLVTFPAREDEGLGVSLVHVEDGVYDHGGTRTNMVEAEAVVAEVERRLADPALRERSIGVVSFNQPQQMLIEDLLDALRRRRPDIEAAFGEAAREPVFVKNLENVQGDERDTILFSIGFGPDEQGQVRLNFGPLNRSGGERRLNVAVTRARQEAVVFTSLRPQHIDPARTKADGARDLRLFLEYAERGPAAFAVATAPVEGGPVGTGGAAESEAFEEQVALALEARGWLVARRLGCSGSRIDLAVAASDEPQQPLLAVECDGASYRAARTARDRDALRPAVLAGLGWRVHRVWSTEWWRDPAREVARIEAAIDRVRGGEEGPGEDVVADAGEAPSAGAGAMRGDLTSDAGGDGAGDSKTGGGWRSAVASEREAAGAGAASSGDVVGDDAPGEPYRVVHLRRSRRAPERFTDADTESAIAAAFAELVAGEAPIALEPAARRVAASFGVERLGARLREALDRGARRAGLVVEEDAGVQILWPAGAQPEAYAGFRPDAAAVGRPAVRGFGAREADELSTRELANGLAWIARTWGAMARRDLVREGARLFGFGRTGRRVEERLELALGRAVEDGRIAVDGERVAPGTR